MKLAYDLKLKRPGCVLVAAGLGADTEASMRFPTSSWLLAPTENMAVYNINEADLQTAIRHAEKMFPLEMFRPFHATHKPKEKP